MALTQEELKQIVQDAIDKVMTPGMKRDRELKEHGFSRAPAGMKAVLPASLVSDYRLKQVRNKQIVSNPNGGNDDN